MKRMTGENWKPEKRKLRELIEKANRTRTAKSKATTPPSLLGILRRIA